MAKQPPMQVTVARRVARTPNLVEITLAGDALADFPTGFEGGYLKLIFLREGERPLLRSYTVARFDADARELDIMMVAHGDTGPAAKWANRVQEGDTVLISGPGACRKPSADADWFLLAGDMSALPAIRANLAELPATARGHVVLEVIETADEIELDRPEGMELTWITNPQPHVPGTLLADTVKALPWRDGRASVWVAGEFGASRALRQYFRHDRKVDRNDLYVSCYWKIGETDEGMKRAKQADAEPW